MGFGKYDIGIFARVGIYICVYVYVYVRACV